MYQDYTMPLESPFLIGLACFVHKWYMSREQYKDLYDVLHLMEPQPEQVCALPSSVDTVKQWFGRSLPLLKQRRRPLSRSQSDTNSTEGR